MTDKKTLSKTLEHAARKGSGAIQRLAKNSRNWFKAFATTGLKTHLDFHALTKNKNFKVSDRIKIGRMYFFTYDAKHKDTLPFWDSCPMVLPIGETSTSILGLNLHYLPMSERAKLLDALLVLVNNDKMDETTKLKVSYQILSSVSRYKLFKPCIKEYLKSNFTSRFIEIPIQHWEMAIFLPVAKWNNASQTEVYKSSRHIISNG